MSSQEMSWHRHWQDLMCAVFALLALCVFALEKLLVVVSACTLVSSCIMWYACCKVIFWYQNVNVTVSCCRIAVVPTILINITLLPKMYLLGRMIYVMIICYLINFMIHVTASLRRWALHVIVTLSVVEEHLTARLVFKQVVTLPTTLFSWCQFMYPIMALSFCKNNQTTEIVKQPF